MSTRMGTTLKTTMTPAVKLGRTAGGGVSTLKTTMGRSKPTASASAGTTSPFMGSSMPPLHGSCHKGSRKEVKKLISMGEDVNEQTKSGMTPLMCAVKVLGPKDGDDGIVAYLIESKANVNMVDVMGDTALHVACCSKDPLNPLLPKGFEKLTQILIDAPNADVNICNKIGQTALHRASLRGNHAMAKQLIAAGCDSEIIDRCGRTAKDIAFDDEMRSVLIPPGLKWQEIEKPPRWGTALSHGPLEEALVAKGEDLDFTQEEWDALEPPVSDLSYSNYVAAGDKFFKPAMIIPKPPPSEEWAEEEA